MSSPLSLAAGFSFDAASTVPDRWPAEYTAMGIHWTDPRFRMPLACKDGANCAYKGVCSSVHPGEEGVGLTFCRACPEKGFDTDGVRLFGTPSKKASFYERRRLRLSWPQWCARVGLPVPEPRPNRRTKQAIGEQLFPIVTALLMETLDTMIAEDLLTEKTTAGKVVGMILDAYTVDELEVIAADVYKIVNEITDAVFIIREKNEPLAPVLCPVSITA